MKVLVLGGSGMLGHKLVRQWNERFEVWTTLRGDLKRSAGFDLFDAAHAIEGVDAENFDSIIKAFAAARPAVVVNCIGVVKQVETVKNPVATLNINSIFPHRLADLCAAANARLITISTDCVFSGEKGNYRESDLPDALDLYGRSKLFGEVAAENCLTLRTSIIGRELGTAHGLLEWFLKNQNNTVNGYTNAIFSGFPTVVLADILADVIENRRSLNGLRHVSSQPISKFDLLCLVRDVFGLNVEVVPFADFYCDRSLNSDLFRGETGFAPESWREMIERIYADAI